MNTAEDRKKAYERFLLEEFIAASRLPAEIVEMRESPDSLVNLKGRSIGIEITRLFKTDDASGHQAQEHYGIRIVARAEEAYRASGGPPARVMVCFAPSCDLRAVNRDRVATKLAAIVQSLDLRADERRTWRPAESDALPDDVSYVSACRAATYARWGIAWSGWVAPVTTEAVQRRVNEKAELLPQYQTVVPENWLLIVADGTRPSQLLEARRPNFDPRAISSPFARAFYYGRPERDLFELGARPAAD